jgi:hypothetical protein
MTVQELAAVKRWQVAHRREHPLEFHAWDLVLTLWMVGWVGLVAATILANVLAIAVCVLCLFAPALYVRLRMRLHAKRRLRCDWSYVIRAAHAMHG